MKILAVDTSSTVAAVAVMDNEKLLGEYSVNHKKTHSQKLMPMVKELMEGLELLPQDIDIYAVSSGPGSFTGLRIGVTSVKAMAYAVKKPVISVPTLDVIAYNIPMCEALVCPMMDARNNQVYTAIYSWKDGSQERVSDYMGIQVSELVQLLRDKSRRTIFAGDGIEIYREYLKGELPDLCEIAPGSLVLQRASSVAHIAYMKAQRGEYENCFDMCPFYLRKSQAERELEKRCQVD